MNSSINREIDVSRRRLLRSGAVATAGFAVGVSGLTGSALAAGDTKQGRSGGVGFIESRDNVDVPFRIIRRAVERDDELPREISPSCPRGSSPEKVYAAYRIWYATDDTPTDFLYLNPERNVPTEETTGEKYRYEYTGPIVECEVEVAGRTKPFWRVQFKPDTESPSRPNGHGKGNGRGNGNGRGKGNGRGNGNKHDNGRGNGR